MKKLIFIFCFICVIIPASLFARVESWYVYMGAGYSHTMYDGVMKDITSSSVLDKQFAFNWDMVHFYFSITDTFTIGPALNVVADLYTYKDPSTNKDASANVFQYFFGPSCMYFFSSETGDGVFLRAEGGLSRLVISYSDSNGDHLEGSNWGNGYGFLLGAGYGLPLGEGTRLLFTLGYTYKHSKSVDGDMLDSSSINATVGVLW
jgi:hypothetical protein